MDKSSLVRQQLGFARQLFLLCATVDNVFQKKACLHSAFLQYELAVKLWIEQVFSRAGSIHSGDYQQLQGLSLVQMCDQLQARETLLQANLGASELKRLLGELGDNWLYTLLNVVASLAQTKPKWLATHKASVDKNVIATNAVHTSTTYWSDSDPASWLRMLDEFEQSLNDDAHNSYEY